MAEIIGDTCANPFAKLIGGDCHPISVVDRTQKSKSCLVHDPASEARSFDMVSNPFVPEEARNHEKPNARPTRQVRYCVSLEVDTRSWQKTCLIHSDEPLADKQVAIIDILKTDDSGRAEGQSIQKAHETAEQAIV